MLAPYTMHGQTRQVKVRTYSAPSGYEDVPAKPKWDAELWCERAEDYYALMSSDLRGKVVRIVTPEDWACHEPKHGTPEWFREHPIFDTDMSKDPCVLIEDIRMKICHYRGQLSDISSGYPELKHQLDLAESGLTLVIAHLYHVIEEERKTREIREQRTRERKEWET